MAGLVLCFFSMPLSTPKTLLKEMRPMRLDICKLSSQSTSKTATKLCSCRRSNRSVVGNHLETSRNLWEIVCFTSNVSFCDSVVLAGYWVGPDIDDGWGFVEAFIDHIT